MTGEDSMTSSSQSDPPVLKHQPQCYIVASSTTATIEQKQCAPIFNHVSAIPPSNLHQNLICSSSRFFVYRVEFKSTYDTLWDQYTNWFTIEQITAAIMSLEDKKDPGPIGITAGFLKHNCIA